MAITKAIGIVMTSEIKFGIEPITRYRLATSSSPERLHQIIFFFLSSSLNRQARRLGRHMGLTLLVQIGAPHSQSQTTLKHGSLSKKKIATKSWYCLADKNYYVQSGMIRQFNAAPNKPTNYSFLLFHYGNHKRGHIKRVISAALKENIEKGATSSIRKHCFLYWLAEPIQLMVPRLQLSEQAMSSQ